ncbi:MAG: radical SAM protein, partial [Candidatus Thorarchaeota archaeon]
EILDAGQDVRDRLGFLEALSDIAGVYVPAKEPTSISRRIVPELDLAFHPTSQIVPIVPDGDVHEPILGKSFLIEVNRGCGHACAFCVVGHICRPRRVRSLKRQLEICEDGLKRTPVGKVAFIGSSVGAVDGLAEIGSMLVHRGVRISVPSLRADSITEELLRTLVEGGQKTLTIAPEVGGQELRYRIRKRISNETFYDVVALASRVGMKFLKAYFIFGLPEESLDDVHEIGRMIARFREIGRMRVTVSLNPFIPKAGTEFERKPQLSLDVLRERMSIVRKSLKHLPGVELEILDPRLARIQAALSVGDRRLGPLIRLAAKYGGLGGWRRAERETGIPFNEIVTGPRRQEDPLPWAFIS